MEELLLQLAITARREGAVASQHLTNGMDLLVYPLEEGVLVALGFDRDAGQQVRAQEVLRRRSDDMRRFGAWQPATFVDGSMYVVRRMNDVDPATAMRILTDEELMAAGELLA